jgi:intein/homing endonuclease
VLCFAAGTQILMADNSTKNIEAIREGDAVKTYDFANKRLINAKVSKLLSTTHSNLVRLKFSDSEITATADHPFWTYNGWSAVDAQKANRDYLQKDEVGKLKAGDRVFIPERNTFSEIIAIENMNVEQITYTIELADSDNFIANGLLVKTEKIE